jgi:hypothetical protein
LNRLVMSGLQQSVGNHLAQRVPWSPAGRSGLRRCGATPCAEDDALARDLDAAIRRDWFEDDLTSPSGNMGSSGAGWGEGQSSPETAGTDVPTGGVIDWGVAQPGEDSRSSDEGSPASDWFESGGGAASGAGDPGSLWTEGGTGSGNPGSAWTEGKDAEDPSQLVSPEDYAIIHGAIQNALRIHGPAVGKEVLIGAAIAVAPLSIPVALVVAVALAIIAILAGATSSGPAPVAALAEAAVAQSAIREALALAAALAAAAITLEQQQKFLDKASAIDAAVQTVIAANVALAQRCFKEVARFGNAIAKLRALLAKPLDQILRDDVIARFTEVQNALDALMACLSGGPSGGGEEVPAVPKAA